ncbi:MAG TPA: protein kinase [Gammaproteobacteria bacterium]|nr:protein kinase [Gammaproteobacteria bacterium]
MAKGAVGKPVRIEAFNFAPGRVLAGKYEVITRLGAGWEGEVYLIREQATGIERTAKLFFPHRNPRDRNAKFYATKLHKLRQCPIVIQYHTREMIIHRGSQIAFLVSDFVEGELLSQFLARQPGKRLSPFQGIHLLHALATGMECIHNMREYHGDLHADNIILQRYGLEFDLKLLDMFHWGAARPENIHDDVVNMIHILYDALGGQKHYARQPPQIKAICRGLKRTLILRQFRSAGQLRQYLETMRWD